MEAYNGDWFGDSYIIRLVLRKGNGEIYREEHDNMSLTDFEVLYGNISDELIEIDMKLKTEEEKYEGYVMFLDEIGLIRYFYFKDVTKEKIEAIKKDLIKQKHKLLLSVSKERMSNFIDVIDEI